MGSCLSGVQIIALVLILLTTLMRGSWVGGLLSSRQRITGVSKPSKHLYERNLHFPIYHPSAPWKAFGPVMEAGAGLGWVGLSWVELGSVGGAAGDISLLRPFVLLQ